ncbi:putative Aminopeptidase N [Streptomyces afghaniensis 772] [Streptomyces afghaniensis]
MSVLTRDEAQTRAGLLDVHRYTIELDLTTGDETFDSRTLIRFSARADGDTFVEVRPAELHSVTLDGQPLDPEALDGNRLPLKNLTVGEHELRVHAQMRYSRTGEGMHRFTDPTDGETYVYTQLFMEDVQRVFAAFDQPDLKAVFELSVRAPQDWTVLANGITEHTGDGLWKAAATPLISTYLVAVAAGPWHSVRTEHRGLPFGLHCRRSLAPYLDTDADELLDVTRACFDRYHEKFDEPYPFDSYDQAFVPEFNAGAMENPGLVTFRDEFVYRSAVTDTERQTRAMVVAHEMAHMWFGDLVTLKWWDDIWLNESFAEYMGYQTLTEATRFTDTWTDFGVNRKAWGYDADQRPSTHPVAPEAVNDTASALLNFDGISYAKGASALRQLVTWLGEKDFLAGINTHFARHKFGNATLADFIDSLAGATERDVHAWADAWLRTTGVDTLTPRVTPGENGTCALTVDRTGSRPHRIVAGLYDRDLGDDGRQLVLRERLHLDLPHTDARPIGKRPALLLLNDGDLSYAKVRFDPESFETIRKDLSGLPEPLTRAVVWNALRDAVRDGELAPAAYLETARAHLPLETDLAIVQGVLAFASTYITDRYVTPEERPAALATLSELCRDLIRRTEDGDNPGLRLIAVRHRIDVTAHPDTIAAWLADGTVPGGPELDRAALARPGPARRPRRRQRGRRRRRTGTRPERHRPGGRRPLPGRPARPGGQGPRLGVHVRLRRPVQLPVHRHRPGLLAARTGRPGTRVRAALLHRRGRPGRPTRPGHRRSRRPLGLPRRHRRPREPPPRRGMPAGRRTDPGAAPQARRPTRRPGTGVAGPPGQGGLGPAT